MWMISGTANPEIAFENAARTWYREVINYDYDTGGSNGGTFNRGQYYHFTAMMWDTTVTVGCGFHTGCGPNRLIPLPSWSVIVCQYSPPPNIARQFADHVFREISAGSCAIQPPPPPIPLSPPAPPNTAYATRVYHTVTISGSISDFDAESYRISIASSLGVSPDDIELNIVSGSVVVESQITIADETRAAAVVDAISDPVFSSPDSLGLLLNVTIERMHPLEVLRVVYVPPASANTTNSSIIAPSSEISTVVLTGDPPDSVSAAISKLGTAGQGSEANSKTALVIGGVIFGIFLLLIPMAWITLRPTQPRNKKDVERKGRLGIRRSEGEADLKGRLGIRRVEKSKQPAAPAAPPTTTTSYDVSVETTSPSARFSAVSSVDAAAATPEAHP